MEDDTVETEDVMKADVDIAEEDTTWVEVGEAERDVVYEVSGVSVGEFAVEVTCTVTAGTVVLAESPAKITV